MAILATLSGSPNLFTNLPTAAPPNEPTTTNASSAPPKPPIPIPKYPPTLKSQRRPQPSPRPESNPALKTFHNRSKYYKPVKEGQLISSDGDRAVVIGESGLSFRLPGAPFDFQFSYSETPKVKPLAIREPAFLPFAPPTMPRPWTGKAPLKQQRERRKIPLFGSLPSETYGVNQLQMPRPYKLGIYPTEVKSRKEVLGKPLTREEIQDLLKYCLSSNRQVNLGRDGLTHNMLELIHSHWRRRPVCKVRCLGVPTIDMENVCRCLEEKTGGKIIRRVGGVVYLFRGRNYDPRTRPRYPVMLWKPAAPVYPKLIQEAPEGLTKAEADELRMKGKNLLPICKLAKNGVYTSLVKDVRNAFEGCPLVKIDCKGTHTSDYKKLGAKLKELVPCVLLSFDEEQILIWRGKDWKSMYQHSPRASRASSGGIANYTKSLGNNTLNSSPKMMNLWNLAIERGKALLLDDVRLGPDTLLQKVEEFESMSQAMEHSYQAVILGSEDGTGNSSAEYHNQEQDCQDGESDDDMGNDFDGPLEEVDYSAPLGSLPVDLVAKQLIDNDD